MKTDQLANRPAMYLFSDGVDELLLGAFLLIYATASAVFPRMGLAGPLLLFVLVFGMKWGRSFLRTHLTARRGGYVEPYVPPHRRLFVACIGGVGTVALLFASRSHLSGAVLCAAIFAAGYLLTGVIYRLHYMFALAALSGALCFWVYRESSDLTRVMQCIGLMNAVAGAVKLWRFVQSHPIEA